jgi:hypothetical protein
MPRSIANRVLDGERISHEEVRLGISSLEVEDQYFCVSYLLTTNSVTDQYGVGELLQRTEDLDVLCIGLIYEAVRQQGMPAVNWPPKTTLAPPQCIADLACSIAHSEPLTDAFFARLLNNYEARLRGKVATYLQHLGPAAWAGSTNAVWSFLIEETDRTVRSALVGSLRSLIGK